MELNPTLTFIKLHWALLSSMTNETARQQYSSLFLHYKSIIHSYNKPEKLRILVIECGEKE